MAVGLFFECAYAAASAHVQDLSLIAHAASGSRGVDSFRHPPILRNFKMCIVVLCTFSLQTKFEMARFIRSKM